MSVRHFVVAIPSLNFCESIEGVSFTDVAEHVRQSGYLDGAIEDALGGLSPADLFKGFEMFIVEEASHHTTAKVRLALTIGWNDGEIEAVAPLPPPGS